MNPGHRQTRSEREARAAFASPTFGKAKGRAIHWPHDLHGIAMGILIIALGVAPQAPSLGQAGFRTDGSRPAAGSPSIITNLGQLRALDRATAKLQLPVKLQGVVTYTETQWPSLFVQEGSNAAYVYQTSSAIPLTVGDRVEIEGRADAGYAPVIQARAIRKLGVDHLPAPVVTTVGELGTGRFDGLRVRVTTTVRWMHVTHGRLFLYVGEEGGRFEVHVPEYRDPLPTHLLEARVELTGITGTKMDARGNMVGAGLSLSSLQDLKIITPAPEHPWERPSQVINTLMYFHPRTSFDQRTKVEGVVTLNTPSGLLYIEDESGGVEVRLPAFQKTPDPKGQYLSPPRPADLKIGDQVEVLAYPDLGAYAPILTDATVRRVGTGALPEPKLVSATNVLALPLDSRRIRLDGRVVASEIRQASAAIAQRLTIVRDQAVFFADYEGAKALPIPLESQVALDGICSFDVDARRRPIAFRVLVARPEDIHVVAGPPLVTTGRLLRVIAPLAAVVLGWVWLLRRQVARQTTALRKALAREQEISQLKSNFVSMVSHEFRTPLGVIVSSTDILRRYLDRLAPAERQGQLDAILRSTGTLAGLIEDLLLLGKVEAGKLNCQPAPLDLQTLCRHLTDEVLSATHHSNPIELQTDDRLEGACADESLLRPPLVNLLANAVKYSAPGSPVEFRVTRRGNHACFFIRDYGIGIPASDHSRLFATFSRGSNVGARQGTGLGLVIARRCIELHGGSLEFESAPGRGTTFTVSIPAFNSAVVAPANAPAS